MKGNRKNGHKWLVAQIYCWRHEALRWMIWRPNIWTPLYESFSNPSDAHNWISKNGEK